MQVDGDLTAFGRRRVTVASKHLALELQHLRLIQLEHHRPVGPRQPVATGVEPRRKEHDLAHPDFGRGLEVIVEVQGPGALEVHEMLAELRLQRVIRGAAVEDGRPIAACRPAEHFGIGINRGGVGFPGLQGPRRGHEQGRRTHACLDVPGVIFGTHVPGYTRGF